MAIGKSINLDTDELLAEGNSATKLKLRTPAPQPRKLQGASLQHDRGNTR